MSNSKELIHLRSSYFDGSSTLLEPHSVSFENVVSCKRGISKDIISKDLYYTNSSSKYYHRVTFTTKYPIDLRKEVVYKYHVKLSIGDLEWIFKIYPFGRTLLNPNYMSVYICLNHTIGLLEKVPATFFLSDGNYYNKDFKKGDMWGIDECLLYKDKEIISFSVCVDPNLIKDKCYAMEKYSLSDNKISNIDLLLSSLGDLIIKGSDWKYCVHKDVISKASCVLKAMLTYENTKEAILNEIEIVDINGDVMKAMLEFMYSGTVNNLDTVVKPLYIAANKYCVEQLEEMCADFLLCSISEDNVIGTLQLADLLNNETLKRLSLLFLSKKFKNVKKSDDWKTLKAFPTLAVEIADYFGTLL